MGIILDLIVIAIILIFVFLGSKKGFVKSVIEVVGFITAIYLAMTLSAPLANFTYDKIVEPAVSNSINKTVENVAENTTQALNEQVFESLPGFVKNNIDISNINVIGYNNVGSEICSNIVKPISLPFIKGVFTLILFIILSFITKILAKLINKLFSFRLIGKVNSVLGGVIGVFKGIIFAVIFIILVNIIVSLTGGFLCFTAPAIESSKLFDTVLSLIPFNF